MKTTLLLLAILGQSFDLASTIMFLKKGLTELNPFFGPTPDPLFLTLSKIAVLCVLVFFCYFNDTLKPLGKIRVLAFAALIGFGAGIWNMYVMFS